MAREEFLVGRGCGGVRSDDKFFLHTLMWQTRRQTTKMRRSNPRPSHHLAKTRVKTRAKTKEKTRGKIMVKTMRTRCSGVVSLRNEGVLVLTCAWPFSQIRTFSAFGLSMYLIPGQSVCIRTKGMVCFFVDLITWQYSSLLFFLQMMHCILN